MSISAAPRDRGIAAEQLRALSFTMGVVLLFSIFLAIVPAGGGPDPFGIFTRQLWDNFSYSAAGAVVMFAMIQPVRRWGPESGWRRGVALFVVVTLACVAVTLARC